MKASTPFTNETLRLGRKAAFHHTAIKGEGSPFTLIAGMKVRRRMVVVEHLDPDSEKSADLWHGGIMAFVGTSINLSEMAGCARAFVAVSSQP